jgi:uncharacterized repeat protein (TIGR01451 family)
MEARQLLATFTVQSLADSGTDTLRQAILNANATPGPDLIRFNLTGSGPFSIAPTSDLPAITDTVTIDGTTQPGYAGRPIIELNGSLDTGAGNTGSGLRINAPGCTVRGLVINRFSRYGIEVANVSGGGTIAGNFIGTDPSGTVAEGNQAGGILVNNSANVIIGGPTTAARNLISGNRNDGIDLVSTSGLPTSNAVLGNLIGINVNGAGALPNSGNGVLVNASGNQVGGVGPDEANTIAFNGLAGVRVGFSNFQTGVTSNPIRGNAIFANNALGIDLGDSGVTLNGSAGTGFGPNRLQGFPVIKSAYPSGGGTTIEGQLTDIPNASFTVDFYANDVTDPSGFGQGQRFLGSTTVMTDPNGVSNFSPTLQVNVPPGQVITATATDRDNNTSEFSRATSVTPSPLADLSLSLDGEPNPVLVGDDLTYTVVVSNNGPSRATNVTVTDALPSNATFISVTPSQGTATVSPGGVLTANLGDLRPGDQATVQVVVQPTAEGTLSNTASVRSDQTDPDPRNNTATVNTTVNPAIPADLAVDSFISVPLATVGKELTYTVVVSNNGPNDQATGVTLVDTLPTNATFVSATTSQGTFTVANGTLTANIGRLLIGGNATVQITVKPTSPGTLTNQATVRGDQTDPNALNNTSTLQTTVSPAPSADLAVAVVALPDPVRVGTPLTYTVYVANTGPGDATGVTLSDELDSGVTFLSATAGQGTVTSSGGTVSANLGTLIAGQIVLVTIVVQPTAIGTMSNTATVQADQPDLVPENNRVTITSQVVEETTPPTVLAQRLLVTRQAITGIVLTFSEPMDPFQAEALNNYSLSHAGSGGLPGAADGAPIPLASARYDPRRRTVTLTPQRPLPVGQFYQLTANGKGASGLTDTSGNVLDGDQNGLPDGIYQTLIGRGTKVRPFTFQRSQLIPIPPPLPHVPHGPHVLSFTRPQPTPLAQPVTALARSRAKPMSHRT